MRIAICRSLGGVEFWPAWPMAKSTQLSRRPSDSHVFPGFRARATIIGLFGDRTAQLYTPDRRAKAICGLRRCELRTLVFLAVPQRPQHTHARSRCCSTSSTSCDICAKHSDIARRRIRASKRSGSGVHQGIAVRTVVEPREPCPRRPGRPQPVAGGELATRHGPPAPGPQSARSRRRRFAGECA